ncbi:MAG: hypothetical protein ACW97G_13860 [Candidatus Thorarchaeota archaeon]
MEPLRAVKDFFNSKRNNFFEIIILGFIGIGVWRTGWTRAQGIFAEYGYYTLYSLPDPPGAFRYRIFAIWFEQFFINILPFSYVTVTVTLTALFFVLSAFFLTRYLDKIGFEYPILGGLLFLVWYPMLTWEYMGTCDAIATALLFFAFWADDDRTSVISALILGGIREFAVGFLFLFEFWRNRRKRAFVSAIFGLGVYLTIRVVLDMMLGSQSILLFPWYWRAEQVGVLNAILLVSWGLVPVMLLYIVSYLVTAKKGMEGSWWVVLLATLTILVMAQPNEVRLFMPFWVFYAPAILNLVNHWLVDRKQPAVEEEPKVVLEPTQD